MAQNVLMSLGLFVFEIPTLTYGTIAQNRSARFGENERFNARAALQYIGPGKSSITLSGVTAYGIQDSAAAFEELADMMATGQAWPLVDGSGNVLGHYVIESLDQSGTMIGYDGQPRKTDWTVGLTRAHDLPDQTPQTPVADDTLSIKTVLPEE